MENRKYPERFTRALTKLYNAYYDGKLEKGKCKKCVVGNMCDGYGEWQKLFCTAYDSTSGRVQQICYYDGSMSLPLPFSDREVRDIEQRLSETGYSVRDLMRIEYTFEAKTPNNTKEGQYKGLCAVVEVLCEIEGIDNVMDISSLLKPSEAPELEEILG